jgi:hypothetical protein
VGCYDARRPARDRFQYSGRLSRNRRGAENNRSVCCSSDVRTPGYTKQTELSAPIAVILVAAVVSARSTLRALAFGLFVGGAAFIILQLSTEGGFWRHIVEYNLHNRFFLQRAFDLALSQKQDALGVLFGCRGVCLSLVD